MKWEASIMLSTSEPNSKPVHRLARFVTEETAAQMFNLKLEQIYLVECWQNVVYVHGEGVSRFVSYADFPPIVGVEPPSEKDFFYWRRRWKKKQPPEKKRLAPEFWVQFFAHQFQQVLGIFELYNWGELLNLLKSVFTQTTWDKLQEVYSKEQWALENI